MQKHAQIRCTSFYVYSSTAGMTRLGLHSQARLASYTQAFCAHMYGIIRDLKRAYAVSQNVRVWEIVG